MARFTERRTAKTTVEVATEFTPVVLISTTALNKMQIFVEECADEVGWLGTVEKEGNTHYITDVFLFDQEVHSTTTEITPEGLAQFGEQILSQPDGMEIWNNLKMWGHSHVNMSVTPSGQDNSQMVKFKDGGHDWFIRLIANKKGDMKLDLYNYEHGIIYTDVRWAEYVDSDLRDLQSQIRALEDQLAAQQELKLAAMKAPIKDEMKTKVRKKTYASTSNWSQNKKYDYPNPVSPGEYANEYGYRVNGVWHRYSPVEQAQVKAQMEAEKKINSTQSVRDFGHKTSGTNGTAVKGFSTESKLDPSSFFDSDDDVTDPHSGWGMSSSELMPIAYADDLDQVQEELYHLYGNAVEFTDEDVERVYRVALKKHPYAMKK